jgi:hypothetical protein
LRIHGCPCIAQIEQTGGKGMPLQAGVGVSLRLRLIELGTDYILPVMIFKTYDEQRIVALLLHMTSAQF